MNFRRTGLGLVVAGAAATMLGVVATVGDSSSTSVFDPSNFSRAVLFGGLAVTVIGALAWLFARPLADLYRGDRRITVQRRVLQVGIPAAAIIVVLGAAATVASANH